MDNIIYRPINENDYAQLKNLICHSFNLDQYIHNINLLSSIKSEYLYSCLAEATYTCVAEKQGKIIGIIMGKANNNYFIKYKFYSILKTYWYQMKCTLYGLKYKHQLQGYRQIHNIYKKFSLKHQNEFDGVLTLFIVDEYYRGLGIGKTLFNNLLKYLKQQQVKKIYLYTDTTCNYYFYEKHGFKRVEAELLQIHKKHSLFNMTIFLYEYTLIN